MILKLKQTPGIYLVGFMGCGKSTVGSALADELGWSFFDLDQEIEKAASASIAGRASRGTRRLLEKIGTKRLGFRKAIARLSD